MTVATILDGQAVGARIQGEGEAAVATLSRERGVGPTTVAMLVRNTQQAYRQRGGG